jgi:hypothetical protein
LDGTLEGGRGGDGCHKDEALATFLGTTRNRDGIDLSDLFVVKDLPLESSVDGSL